MSSASAHGTVANQLVRLQGKSQRPFTILDISALSLFSSPQKEPFEISILGSQGENSMKWDSTSTQNLMELISYMTIGKNLCLLKLDWFSFFNPKPTRV